MHMAGDSLLLDHLGDLIPLGRARVGRRVDSQTDISTTSLALISLAGHIAHAVILLRASGHLIPAEALSTIFGSGNCIAAGVAVVDTIGVSDGVLPNVGKLDAGENARRQVVGVTARVSPAFDWGRGIRAGCGCRVGLRCDICRNWGRGAGG